MSKGSEKRARRSRLSRLLEQFGPRSAKSRGSEARVSRGDKLKLESLEARQLLAGDVSIVSTDLAGPVDSGVEIASTSSTTSDSGLRAATTPEGEPAPDLVQFAEDLAAAGVIFYGANWCPACTEQKELFEDGKDNLPFIEVTNPDRSAGQIAIDNNVTAYPTWVFPDNTRATGVLTLQQLSDRANVAIPQSEDPTFETIGDQTALIGSPLHVPVDAYDPNGEPLTVTVSVADPNLLDAEVITGNRSIRIDMQGYGDMVFELFEQRAPTASGRVIQLAEDNFYDDIIFHRVIDDFVIQGGDPTGTGTSGSTLGNFDDDFHPELQHNRKGVLSFAKSSDDTNNSQFFVTEVPTRFLDYNHSVFGQLIEGEDVRDAISEHAVNGADRPTTDITINTIDVFTDTENSLIMLKPTGNGVGSTNVTVTVTDGDGNTHSETFQVDVNNDTANSQPYLNAVTVPNSFPAGIPATLQMSSTDIEGDAVSYSAVVISGGSNASAAIDQNGLLTVTPTSGFTGSVDVQVTVRPGTGVTGNSSSDSDNQVLTFTFENEATAPTSIDLLSSSDTGTSDSDNVTNASTLSFFVEGVIDGATVQLINQQTSAVLGQAVATGNTVTITTNNIAALGDGAYNITARQIVGSETSPQSSAISVTYDTVEPESVAASANTRANVGRLYQTDLINAEEGAIVYALTQFPVGATIDSGSGVIEWTPESGDEGDEVFTVTTTDLAGNTRTENFTVTVAAAPLAEVKLVIKDTSGNEVDSVNVGQDFILELVGVDARGGFSIQGVFAAYADILFDSSIVQVKSGTTIDYVGDFTLAPKGSFSTGLIDEIGAASTRTQATGSEESTIARIEMTAISAGSVNIRSEEADESSSEFLLFGIDNNIPAESVFYGNVNLAVGIDFTLADDTVTVAEDSGATTIDVLGNDTAGSGGALSVVSATQPSSGGTVSVDSGVVSFTPAQDFNGTAEFTYLAGDGSGAQTTATVTVTVTPVNDAPTGTDDTFEVIEGTSGNRLEVLTNDSSDPDSGETLSVTSVNTSTAGVTVQVSSDGQAVEYTPASGFTGTDTFTYTLSDGSLTDTVTVTVTVTSADPPPTAVDDPFDVTEDDAEASFDVLQNDLKDVDDQDFVIDSVGTPSDGGSVRFSSDGSTLFYAPAADFNGTETVTYTIRDTGGGVSTGTVTFTVEAVNDPPPVLNDTIQVSRGSNNTVILQIDDLPDNVDASETLTFVLTTAEETSKENGTVAISGGDLIYTPPSDFTGTDIVTYSVSDGSGANSSGTLTVEVIDLTERNISVQFSGNQAATVASSIRLTGTDALGNTIQEIPTLSGNTLLFQSVLPGEYVVEIPAIPFFSGGDQAQQYSINSAPEDGDAVVEASMGRIKPEYLSIQDWFGSAPRQSALVVIAPGGSELLSEATEESTESITDPTFELNEAGTELTIEGSDGESHSSLTSDLSTISPRGQVGNLRLFRVNLNQEYSAPVGQDNGDDSSQSATGNGEGEQVTAGDVSDAVTDELVQPSSVGGGLSVEGFGEGELVEQADLVEQASSVNEVAAPLLSSSLLQGEDDESETPVSETGIETDTPVRLSASSSSGATDDGAAESASVETSGDSDSGADEEGDGSESSSLSPSSVDRFFRRGL